MATLNPFVLLDDDAEDPSLLLAAQQKAVAALVASAPAQTKKAPAKAQSQPATAAKLPSKPPPPAQAVKDTRNEVPRGGRSRGFNRETVDNESTFGTTKGVFGGYNRPSNGDVDRHPYSGPRGGRRGGFSNGENEDGRRPSDRRSGTGRG